MATLQDIKRKISAVKKTQQITRAMNMVAAARLRVAQERIGNFRPYASKFSDMISNLASRTDPDIHPFLIQPEEVSRVSLIAFSSDRGLCGSFNSNVIAGIGRFMKEKKSADQEVELSLVGRKAFEYYKRRPVNIKSSYSDVMNRFDFQSAVGIAREASESFLLGEVDEVWIYYTQFVSVAKQNQALVKLLPISPVEEEEDQDLAAGASEEYLVEPSAEAIMMDLLPRSVNIQIYNALLETSASEHAARMLAMDNATKNCSDLIDDLTMVMNKARQASITMELMDIIGGAEALKS